MESRWRKAKHALGRSLCVHVPRTLDEVPPSEDFSDSTVVSPAADSRLPSEMAMATATATGTGSTQVSKSGSKSFKVLSILVKLESFFNFCCFFCALFWVSLLELLDWVVIYD